MADYLADAYPLIGDRFPRLELAELPTPVDSETIMAGGLAYPVTIKRDDLSGRLYGGNKVRKLEYLLQAARQHNAGRVATFGTVASNHALATTLYCRSLGLPCTCLLSNQVKTPAAARALNLHLDNETEIVRYGGSRKSRIAILREHLWHRDVFLIPPGGSNWIGAIGFVNAGLELADQIESHVIEAPDRLYVANGTMATAVGLSLGLALAGLDTEVQAIQVTDDFVSSPAAMQRLLEKTATLLNRIEPSFPATIWRRARYEFRTGYRGAGYARTNDATEHAIAVAREQLGLHLEATYTGKAMAALLDDLESRGGHALFWNTYNSRPLRSSTERPDDTSRLPREFLRYFD
jgi:1-aminocyclopropane-1-carboxylate deaminase/D-cysteine desulfhydrase-like pyridoxal-dependent ACC family enzyme